MIASNLLVSSRRKVLTIGAGFLLGGVPSWSALTKTAGLFRTRREGRALGSNVVITVLHGDLIEANAVLDRAFRELDAIEDVLSIYRPHSEVSRLNARGFVAKPHRHLRNVLPYARRVSRASQGAFDITVQPLWMVFHESDARGVLPDDSDILAAKSRVDWRRVHCSDERAMLEGEGTAITLNGIAQGYAVDCVRGILKDGGIDHALVDCGELGAWGQREQDQAWKVGIQHPRESEAFVSVANLSECCLATSGDYATRFRGDYRWNHLFDPTTGRSPDELASVSVVAPTAMTADALSTAVFVAGVERGMALRRDFPETEMFLVLKSGRVLRTKGFPCER